MTLESEMSLPSLNERSRLWLCVNVAHLASAVFTVNAALFEPYVLTAALRAEDVLVVNSHFVGHYSIDLVAVTRPWIPIAPRTAKTVE